MYLSGLVIVIVVAGVAWWLSAAKEEGTRIGAAVVASEADALIAEAVAEAVSEAEERGREALEQAQEESQAAIEEAAEEVKAANDAARELEKRLDALVRLSVAHWVESERLAQQLRALRREPDTDRTLVVGAKASAMAYLEATDGGAIYSGVEAAQTARDVVRAALSREINEARANELVNERALSSAAPATPRRTSPPPIPGTSVDARFDPAKDS